MACDPAVDGAFAGRWAGYDHGRTRGDSHERMPQRGVGGMVIA